MKDNKKTLQWTPNGWEALPEMQQSTEDYWRIQTASQLPPAAIADNRRGLIILQTQQS